MSLEIPTWDKIQNSLNSTTNEFGGKWGNLISDYFNGENLAITDPSKLPIIGTFTRYKHEKLGLYDVDGSHYISFSVDDIDTGANRKIKFRRMNAPFTDDYAVLEGLAQAIINKTIDGDLNTITNIGDSEIVSHISTKITINDKTHLNSAIMYNDINNSIGAHYIDINRMSDPGNPSTDMGRFFIEQIDSNNEGVFCRVKKAGSFQKVQII